jgi:regulator of nucleoside diphosphate kinase
MRNKSIYITDYDIERLSELLTAKKILQRYPLDPICPFIEEGFNHHRDELQGLEAELDRAQTLASRDVPENLVTMNSRVRFIDLATGEEMACSLVFPDEADIDQNKVSVLAPIGTALLGYKAGDTLELKVPTGLRRLRIKEVLYQPEAAGADHL